MTTIERLNKEKSKANNNYNNLKRPIEYFDPFNHIIPHHYPSIKSKVYILKKEKFIDYFILVTQWFMYALY